MDEEWLWLWLVWRLGGCGCLGCIGVVMVIREVVSVTVHVLVLAWVRNFLEC